MSRFSDVVDAVSELSVTEQETLLQVLQRRVAEAKRDNLVQDVKEARAEFSSGAARTATVREIMDEVSGEA